MKYLNKAHSEDENPYINFVEYEKYLKTIWSSLPDDLKIINYGKGCLIQARLRKTLWPAWKIVFVPMKPKQMLVPANGKSAKKQ